MPDHPSVAHLLSAALRALGVRRAFRAPGSELPDLPGIDELAVPSVEVATALADADGRLATGAPAPPGVALLPGRQLRLTAQPGADVGARPVADAASLVLAVAGWSLGDVHGAVVLDLELDLGAAVPDEVEAVELSEGTNQLTRLSPTLAGFRTVLLAGPGVARAGQHAALLEAVHHTGAGVACTPGAVGVVPAEHPSFLGVVGLQAGDAERSGLDAAELVIAAGLDPAETPELEGGAQLLEVEPWQLGLMALHWEVGEHTWTRSALQAALAELVEGQGVAATGARPAPWALLHELRGALAGAGRPAGAARPLVAAEPGIAGLWLARGLPVGAGGAHGGAGATEGASTVRTVVPARPAPGFAAAAAFVNALDGGPGVALLDHGVADPVTDPLLDLAAGLDLPVTVLSWTSDPGQADVALDELGDLVADGPRRRAVAVDLERTDLLLDLLGPVVAWGAGG